MDADVVVVGGGLNGAPLALACASAGLSVIVLEAAEAASQSEPGFDGRAYALAHASTRLLGALGVWDPLAKRAQPIRRIRVAGGRPGERPSRHVLGFDQGEIEEGPMGHMIEDRYLRRALLDALAASERIEHRPGTRVVAQAVAGGHATATLADGAVLRTRLLVGADGRASGTAARAGLRRGGRDYGQTALVAAVAHERSHHATAHQVFLPGGPLAILPLPGERSSIVWSEKRALADGIRRLDDAGFLAALRPRFGDFLGRLHLAGERYAYPLSLSLVESPVAERVALIGDAAHGIHPLAGQGLNLGLRDVAALAEVLADARRRGEDIGAAAVLRRYRRWRRTDIATLAGATDALDRLFSNDNPLLRAGREAGLGAVARLPGLRRRFIREAAGLTGDRPRLLRGKRP